MPDPWLTPQPGDRVQFESGTIVQVIRLDLDHPGSLCGRVICRPLVVPSYGAHRSQWVDRCRAYPRSQWIALGDKPGARALT